jgi:hypothetical protein
VVASRCARGLSGGGVECLVVRQKFRRAAPLFAPLAVLTGAVRCSAGAAQMVRSWRRVLEGLRMRSLMERKANPHAMTSLQAHVQ